MLGFVFRDRVMTEVAGVIEAVEARLVSYISVDLDGAAVPAGGAREFLFVAAHVIFSLGNPTFARALSWFLAPIAATTGVCHARETSGGIYPRTHTVDLNSLPK